MGATRRARITPADQVGKGSLTATPIWSSSLPTSTRYRAGPGSAPLHPGPCRGPDAAAPNGRAIPVVSVLR